VLEENLLDPNREVNVSTHVNSILQTIKNKVLQEDIEKKLRKDGRSYEEFMKHQRELDERKRTYSIHKDCAIVGFDIARRPKYHLIASVMFLINF